MSTIKYCDHGKLQTFYKTVKKLNRATIEKQAKKLGLRLNRTFARIENNKCEIFTLGLDRNANKRMTILKN